MSRVLAGTDRPCASPQSPQDRVRMQVRTALRPSLQCGRSTRAVHFALAQPYEGEVCGRSVADSERPHHCGIGHLVFIIGLRMLVPENVECIEHRLSTAE